MASGFGKSMPLVTAPANTLREGHSSFQHSTEDIHPVDAMQQQEFAGAWSNKVSTAARIYGSHAALRLKMDRSILAQYQRLPGMPSSFAGLDCVLQRDTKIDFSDVLAPPDLSPDMPKGVHEVMAAKLG